MSFYRYIPDKNFNNEKSVPYIKKNLKPTVWLILRTQKSVKKIIELHNYPTPCEIHNNKIRGNHEMCKPHNHTVTENTTHLYTTNDIPHIELDYVTQQVCNINLDKCKTGSQQKQQKQKGTLRINFNYSTIKKHTTISTNLVIIHSNEDDQRFQGYCIDSRAPRTLVR